MHLNKDIYLSEDISTKIKGIKSQPKLPDYLELEELNKLVKTECPSEQLKNAALFCALTGLRFSDVKKLEWNHLIKDSKGNYSIKYTIKKTKSNEILPIGKQAYDLLGEPKEEGIIFEGLKNNSPTNLKLEVWTLRAGINKKVTFHTFRHTYATLQLSEGKTDIYTVSKLLGHKNLATTQIYAKVIDQSKRDASDKIKLDL